MNSQNKFLTSAGSSEVGVVEGPIRKRALMPEVKPASLIADAVGAKWSIDQHGTKKIVFIVREDLMLPR